MEQYHQQNTLEAVSQEQVAEEELIVPRRTTTEVVFRHEVVDKQVVVPRKSKRIQIQDSLYITLLGSEGKNGEYSQFFSDLGLAVSFWTFHGARAYDCFERCISEVKRDMRGRIGFDFTGCASIRSLDAAPITTSRDINTHTAGR